MMFYIDDDDRSFQLCHISPASQRFVLISQILPAGKVWAYKLFSRGFSCFSPEAGNQSNGGGSARTVRDQLFLWVSILYCWISVSGSVVFSTASFLERYVGKQAADGETLSGGQMSYYSDRKNGMVVTGWSRGKLDRAQLIGMEQLKTWLTKSTVCARLCVCVCVFISKLQCLKIDAEWISTAV